MKQIIASGLLAGVALTGCANLKFQWSASYATDNLLADLQRPQAAEQAKQPAAEVSK